MPRIQPKNTWLLAVSGGVAAVLVIAVVSLTGIHSPLNGVIRLGALLGYLAVFLASLSSNYMRELTRFFGRAFVKVHHVISVTALVALTLHAVAVAWQAQSLAAFLPDFSSWRMFLTLGGRPAFWLIAITSVTALLRTSIGDNWKVIHWLNYVAFFLGTVHGWLIGSTFDQLLIVRIVSLAMAAALVVVFAARRLAEYRRKQRRQRA